jgi:drug/metabolite transporter (DMT)-like permease
MLGLIHFIDIFSPFLWKWMFVYGGVIIAFGFYCWFVSLPVIKSVDFSIGNAFAPVAGIFFAYLIVGEIPDRGQIIGGSLILAGIASTSQRKLAHLAPLKKITGLTKIRNFIGV